jgi:hypothetical protein
VGRSDAIKYVCVDIGAKDLLLPDKLAFANMLK